MRRTASVTSHGRPRDGAVSHPTMTAIVESGRNGPVVSEWPLASESGDNPLRSAFWTGGGAGFPEQGTEGRSRSQGADGAWSGSRGSCPD